MTKQELQELNDRIDEAEHELARLQQQGHRLASSYEKMLGQLYQLREEHGNETT